MGKAKLTIPEAELSLFKSACEKAGVKVLQEIQIGQTSTVEVKYKTEQEIYNIRAFMEKGLPAVAAKPLKKKST